MFIHHHLGLGDHLICNGLVRYLATERPVKLFCKHKNHNNVSFMYKNNTNIQILPIKDDAEATNIGYQQSNYLRLGIALNSNFPSNLMWDEVFYYQIGLPYKLSWTNFFIDKPKSQNRVPKYPYSLVSNMDSTKEDRIDYSKVNHNIIYTNIGGFFDNIDLILNATEIHSIDTAYLHLIDRLDINSNTKLFYHKNFKPKYSNIHSNFTLNKQWVII